MTDVTRLLDIQFGLHSTAADFSSTPGTVSRLLPRSIDGVYPRQRTPIDRPLIASDGRRHKRVHGARDLAPINVGMEFRGQSNAAGGAVTIQNVMEQARMLDSFFGAAAAAISGAATTATGGTPGSGILTVSSGTNIADGDMVLFRTGSATGPVVMREVASGGGTSTLTFDRAYTGTPYSTGTVWRAGRWNLSTTVTHHIHGYFRAEGENWRRDYYGCFCDSITLDIPDAGPVSFDSVWMPTDWADVAEANPAYSAPTAGQPTVASGCDFRIAGTAFLLRNAKLTLSNGAVPRASTTGPNGVQGYVAGSKTNVLLEGELYVGDNANTIGELVDGSGTPTLNSLLGDGDDVGDEVTSRDISIAVGGAENAAFYARIPAADIRGQVADSGGLAVYRFQAHATAPSSGSAFRLGVF